MARIEITFRTEFWLSLFRRDVDLLMKLAEYHYDSTCRMAGNVGGFLYGWYNITRGQSECGVYKLENVPKCSGNRRELDTVLKICEGTRLALSSKLITTDDALRLDTICATILTAMEAGAIACDVMNTKVEPITAPSPRGSLQWATALGRM